jgi:hypothetical protein
VRFDLPKLYLETSFQKPTFLGELIKVALSGVQASLDKMTKEPDRDPNMVDWVADL